MIHGNTRVGLPLQHAYSRDQDFAR